MSSVGRNPPKRILLRQGYGGYPPRIHSGVYPAFVALGYYGRVGHPWLSAKEGKPRTKDLRPWLWGAALTGRSEHSSPRLRTGRSVVRGKGWTLLIAQRLDGIEFGSLIGWLETEKDAYSGRNAAS